MRKKIVLYWPDSKYAQPTEQKVNDLKLKSTTLATLAGAIKEFQPVSLQSIIALRHLHISEEKASDETFLQQNINLVENYTPDILCIGNWTSNFPLTIEFVKKYRARNKNCTIILGGHPATFTPNEVLNIVPEVDYLIRGEGEFALRELITKLVEDQNTHNVKSISFRNKHGDIVHNPRRELIDPLDKLPIPDYESFECGKNEGVYTVMTERGCFYNCNFCSSRIMGQIPRLKSVGRVLKEIKILDTDFIFFGSNNFTSNRDFVVKLCRGLKDYNVGWHCMSRVDTVDQELLHVMQDGGCKEISLGPESIVPQLLIQMDKTAKEKVDDYIKLCWTIPRYAQKIGLDTRANVVIGFPSETPQMLKKTLNYIANLHQEGINTNASLLTVYPGTPLWNLYKEGSIKLVKRPSYERAFFSSKYDYLPWAYPDAWRPKNQYMDIPELDRLVYEHWAKKVESGQ